MQRELTHPAAASSPLTFEQAYERFASYVARIGQRVMGRREEVKDLVHDVFLASRGALHKLDSDAAARAYFGVVTVRLARRRLRRERLFRWVGLDAEDDLPEAVDPSASPAQRAMLSNVYAVLKTLPADQQVAWTLRYVEGAQLEEVAELCRCSLATVKRRIAAAHAVVQQRMNDE